MQIGIFFDNLIQGNRLDTIAFSRKLHQEFL